VDNIEKLWKQFDGIEEYGSMSLSSKRRPCFMMLKILTDEELKHEVQLEDDLLVLGMGKYHLIENLDRVDKNEFEKNMKDFVKRHGNDFDYYKKRYVSTRNISDKWRYALICWFYDRGSNFLENAIMILLDCVNKCKTRKFYYKSIKMLSCAYNLALIYNLKNKLSKQIAKHAFIIINDVRETENARWIIEPTQILANLDILNHYSASYLTSTLHREARRFISRVEDSNLQQQFLVVSKDLCKFQNLNSDEKLELQKIIQSQIAESWEKSGNRRCNKGDAICAILDYKKSIEEYSKIGYSDKQKELGLKTRDLYNNIEWDVNQVIIKEEHPIILKGDNEHEIFNSISSHNDIIPDLSCLRQSLERSLREYPLLTAPSRIDFFNEKNPVSESHTEEKIIQSELQNRIVHHIHFHETRLSSAVKSLEDHEKISAAPFIQFISSCGFLSDVSRSIISKGITEHFQQNYISSIHILMPQIEAVLKSLLVTKGIIPLKLEKKKDELAIINENELGGLLEIEDAKNLLGENFTKYLKVKFVDQNGINLRNKISHGLIESLEDFNHTTSYSLIHIIMMLSKKLQGSNFDIRRTK
jgi:hypothetical protein